MSRPGEPRSAQSGTPLRPDRAPIAAAVVGLIASGLATAAAGLAGLGAPAPRVRQPIAFDHQLHARQLELACSACHDFEGAEAGSLLPAADLCATCHAEPIGVSAEEAKLVLLLGAGEPLAWQPLFGEPRHVFFPHRRHAAVAGIGCERCHQAFAEARAPPQRVRRLRMDDCLGCHRLSAAPTGCTTCHR